MKLKEIADNIWLVETQDQYELAMTFLRYQEYYESPDEKFYRQPFAISDFQKWYKKRKKSEYHLDWAGFNVPSEIIFKCMETIPDYNEWDLKMGHIINEITSKTKNKFYLIGTLKGETTTLKHELAHGFYYTIPEYKEKMNKLYLKLPENVKNYLLKFLKSSGGYHPEVYADETQAYLSSNEILQFMFEKESNDFKKVFNRFSSKYLKNIY
jgi:hypothetical protein